MTSSARRWTLTEIGPSLPPHAMGPRVGLPGQSVSVLAVDDVRAAIAAEREGLPTWAVPFSTRHTAALETLDRVAARLGLEDDIERTGSDGGS